MKMQFRIARFTKPKMDLLIKCNQIIDNYTRLGYRLTLRQLYYQLVARNLIPNRQNEYTKLSELLTNARMAGLVDWDAIEDRGRVPHLHPEWKTIEDLVASALYSFRLPRWSDQPEYIELWTEKEALASILMPIVDDFHIHLVINKGYSSASAMYRSMVRFRHAISEKKSPTLLYLGDHDPSGLDMDRDIDNRFSEFGVSINFQRIGLLMEQINELSLPPNPAKMSDPRYERYRDEHDGLDDSWEVDAIGPDILDKIVRAAIMPHINMELFSQWQSKEVKLGAKLKKAASEINEDEEDDDNDLDGCCQNCGTELPEEGDDNYDDGRCLSCGYHPDDDECPHCGHRFDATNHTSETCPECDKYPDQEYDKDEPQQDEPSTGNPLLSEQERAELAKKGINRCPSCGERYGGNGVELCTECDPPSNYDVDEPDGDS